MLNILVGLIEEKMNVNLVVLWHHVVKDLNNILWVSVICLLSLLIQLTNFSIFWTKLSLSKLYQEPPESK